MSSIGSRYWRRRLSRWPGPGGSREGYTLLLPVPGDLPVFLDLSLTACAAQGHVNRRSTIVLPDRPSPAIERLVASRKEDWPDPLRLVYLPLPERWFLPLLKSGSRNHGMQVITGVGATTTTHVILHDADLFPLRTDLHERQYEVCRSQNLDCYGVSGVWDPWYATHGLDLAATWELCARSDWVRSSPPWEHIGHDNELFGEHHTFDTTLLPQARSDPTLIGHADLADAFVHFNYVITSYRLFQKHGTGYLDDRFRLLFISFVIELLGGDSRAAGLPTVRELAADLDRPDAEVRYSSRADGAATYTMFRSKLDGFSTAEWLPYEDRIDLTSTLAAFDRRYGYPAAA